MSSIKPVLQSAVARAASFIPAAIATLLTSRLIIGHFGVPAFNSFSLVISLILLIPLQDLGVGAATTSAFAASGPQEETSIRTVLTAARTLTLSTLGLGLASLGLAAFDAWPRLLGAGSGPNAYVAAAVCIYALSFLPGLGQPMLLGIDRNHAVVVIQTLWNPLMLAGTAGLILVGGAPGYLVLLPGLSILIVNLITALHAVRATAFSWRRIVRELPWPRRYPGASIRAIAGPMLMITLTVPLLLQSDRIVLSHVGSVAALADYSVVIQIFAPVAALLAASSQPLWPIWLRARASGERGPALGAVVAVFCGTTGVICGVLVLIADPVGHVIGHGSIHLGYVLPIAAALAMTTQAAAYPVGMALMDPPGIRFLGICAVLALPLNIALSILFARAWGAPGPLLATFVVGLVVQTLPALAYARARVSSGRHRHDPRRPAHEQILVATLLSGVQPGPLDTPR